MISENIQRTFRGRSLLFKQLILLYYERYRKGNNNVRIFVSNQLRQIDTRIRSRDVSISPGPLCLSR